jgi:hypothetical protein
VSDTPINTIDVFVSESCFDIKRMIVQTAKSCMHKKNEILWNTLLTRVRLEGHYFTFCTITNRISCKNVNSIVGVRV